MQAQLEQEASKAKALESALQQAVFLHGQQQQALLSAKSEVQALKSLAANASDFKLATEIASLKVRKTLLRHEHREIKSTSSAHSSAAPL